MPTIPGVTPSDNKPKGTSISSSGTNKNKTVTGSAANLGKDDFMKLLLAQLQNQDPLKPMDNQQFIAQVAQFNALEQMTSVNKTLAAVLDSQQLASASGMIGKTVSATGADGKAITGVVSAASVEKGVSMVHIGDKKVALDKITGVAADAANLPPKSTATSGEVPAASSSSVSSTGSIATSNSGTEATP